MSKPKKAIEAALRNYKRRLQTAIIGAAKEDGIPLQAGLLSGLYADVAALEAHLERTRTREEAIRFVESLDDELSAEGPQ